MSKADKMFEELGYEKIVEHKWTEEEYTDEDIVELIHYEDEVIGQQIQFWSDKTINKESTCGENEYITMQELKAINTKVGELNWIQKENGKK